MVRSIPTSRHRVLSCVTATFDFDTRLKLLANVEETIESGLGRLQRRRP